MVCWGMVKLIAAHKKAVLALVAAVVAGASILFPEMSSPLTEAGHWLSTQLGGLVP